MRLTESFVTSAAPFGDRARLDYGPAEPGSGLFSNDMRALDLGGLILFLRRRWQVILSGATVSVVLGLLFLLGTTPYYTASASVAVQSQRTKVVDIQDVVAGLTPDQATMETQVAVLRSRRLAALLADRLHLDQRPEFDPPSTGSARHFSLLAPATWSKGAGAAFTSEPAARHAQMISRIVARIEIAALPHSYVLTLTAHSQDAELAAAMANTLAELYISDGIAAKYETTRKAAAYLQHSVDALRTQAVATDRATEAYRAHAGLAGSDEGTTVAGQQMHEINSLLVTARAERAAKEAQLAQLRDLQRGGGNGGVEASSAAVASPVVQSLREQEGEVVRKLGELRATLGERHPRIINAEAELHDLRAQITDEIARTAAATANDVAVARAREATLAASFAQVEGAVESGGAARVRLRDLQRESDANRTIYETFLNRLKETSQQGALQQPDARIVSNADLPLAPSFPKVGQTLLAAIALGLVGGAALAFAIERLDNTVRSATLLESLGGGAALAFVPAVARGKMAPEDVVVQRSDSRVAEALRTLRSSLALGNGDEPPQVVMLSSSVPMEGKTFIGTGLARVSAQAGVTTILVDCDTRHPRAHAALATYNDAGLIQVLTGATTLDQALKIDEATGLHILTAGSGAINPADLLRSEPMVRLFATLRERYAFIVVDAPPFVPMTDSQILARLVDSLVLVVRWGETPLSVVQATLRQIRRVGAPLAGSVLSQVDVERHAHYGFGDHRYQHAKYRSYYGDMC